LFCQIVVIMLSNLIENRTIRVFISSTFQDMQDERTELMKKTFPRLRVMAAKRDVTLTEVDLRWGITKEESESGKVVDICLREIQNSIPFFIGIIGNRYGWIPSSGDIEESTFDRFNQVRSYVERKLSVTDMEMQFGVLEHKEDLHAFFYINDNKEERDNNPEKLADLKRVVRLNGRYPVYDYSSPEDLAKQVEEAFACLLDELFPENHSLSFFEKERISQRSFLNQLSQSYVRVKENFEKLDSFLAGENQQYLIVTGESGLGKSALVANWVKGLSDKKQTKRKIIYHFIGNGGSLGSHHHVVKTLCAELKDQFKLEAPFDEQNREKWDRDDSDTLEMLYNQISADKDGCLIVLDAVNQLVDMDNAKSMRWFGFPPLNVKVLITTLKEDVTMDVFKRREHPVFELKPLGLRQRRKLVKDYLKDSYGKHLTDDQVAAIINDRQSSNTLVLKTLLDELVSFGSFSDLEKRIQYYLEPESIPDFYQRVLARFEDDFGKDTVSHVLSLILLSREGLPEDAIIAIVKLMPIRWSQLYCSLISHLNVKMGIVYFSHRYFSEAVQQRYFAEKNDYNRRLREEIIGYFRHVDSGSAWAELGYQYDKLDDNQSLHALLIKPNRFLYFYHAREIDLVQWWYKLESTGKYCFEEYLDNDPLVLINNSEFAISLSAVVRFLYYHERRLIRFEEKKLSVRLSYLGNVHSDVADSFESVGHCYENVGDFDNALEGYEKALSIRLTLYGESHLDVAESYSRVGHLLEHDKEKSLKCYEKALSIQLSILGENHIEVAETYYRIGNVLGSNRKALDCFEKALLIKRLVLGERHPDVVDLYGFIGDEYAGYRDDIFRETPLSPDEEEFYDKKALEYKEKALSIKLASLSSHSTKVILTMLLSPSTILTKAGIDSVKKQFQLTGRLRDNLCEIYHSYSAVAYEYAKKGDDDRAFDLCKKSYLIELLLYGDEDLSISPATVYSSLGRRAWMSHDLTMAVECFEKNLSVVLSIMGEGHIYTAEAFDEAASGHEKLKDYKLAIEYRLKALEIAETTENTDMAATIMNELGRSYKTLGQIDKSNDYFRRAAEKWNELGNYKKAGASLSAIVENK